jgi:hypothetical protein
MAQAVQARDSDWAAVVDRAAVEPVEVVEPAALEAVRAVAPACGILVFRVAVVVAKEQARAAPVAKADPEVGLALVEPAVPEELGAAVVVEPVAGPAWVEEWAAREVEGPRALAVKANRQENGLQLRRCCEVERHPEFPACR